MSGGDDARLVVTEASTIL
jgi:hypothetical protein